jgi:protein O-GlcNAc transferase
MEHHLAGRSTEAESVYRRILAADPKNADALHRLGVLNMQKGEHLSAIDLLCRATIARPESANIHASLGQAYAATGRDPDAIRSFERALAIKSDLTEALFGLGVAFQHIGERQKAADVYRRLIAINPDNADARNNLGNALFGLGKLAEAVQEYRRAIELQPGCVQAIGNLGSALCSLGNTSEAIDVLRRALRLSPDSAVINCNLGNALLARKQFDEALTVFRRALELKPDMAPAAYNLGNALVSRGKYQEAVEAFRRAIQIDPNYLDAHNNLGNALQAVRDYKAAAEAYLAVLKIKPDYAVAYNNLGNALRTMGKTDEAITALQQAIKLRPNDDAAYSNLGNAFKDAGRIGEAMKSYRRSVEIQPRQSIAHSNLCFSMTYDPDCDSQAILHEALRWNVLHAQPLKTEIRPHNNFSAESRKLRIGYVGADFREHCQSLFTIPLLSNHDRERFEIFVYSQVSRPDERTDRIRACADVFRPIRGTSDQEAAEIIRTDRIDVLVDLTMHMSSNRLLVFARKPAPVQITWLAYPGTTGLAAMDYRFTDPYLDPLGSDHFYAEKSYRLPETFWCYDPLADEIDPGPLPASSSGHITFGCLNNFCKVTDPTLELWLPILQQLPESRLILLASHGGHRIHLCEYFKNRGVDPNRVEFIEFQPRNDYLHVYRKIDIGLDTLPYNGHTTSLDSFWMGVPVVTRLGRTVVGRAGWSQLCNLNLKELAAESGDQFVKIALDLAGDLRRLAELRNNLRNRMQQSPLMDASRFARNLETAYQQMYRAYSGAAKS